VLVITIEIEINWETARPHFTLCGIDDNPWERQPLVQSHYFSLRIYASLAPDVEVKRLDGGAMPSRRKAKSGMGASRLHQT
jgi:hypothetical protein